MKSSSQPPLFARWFLRWFCSEELIEEIEGDLQEAFFYRLKSLGPLRAKFLYITDVLRFFRPYAFEQYSGSKQYVPMVKNYIKIAFRNLLKRKGLAFINLTGLSVGIAAVLLVSIYLYHELSYDRHVPESDKIFRLVNNYRDQTYTCMNFDQYYNTPGDDQHKLLNHLVAFEEVSDVAHFVPNFSAIGPNSQFFAYVGEKEFVFKDFLFTNTGNALNRIFPQKFIQGSAQNAWSKFQTMVLSEQMVIKLFGDSWRDKNITEKTIRIGEENYAIGGVVEDPPGNMHFSFGAIVHQEQIPSWGAYTYIKLNDPALIGQVMDRFNNESDLVYPGRSEDVLQKGSEAVALTDIHFTKDMLYEIKPTADNGYLATFAVTGLLILLIIWTNYTNLAIATYANRQKELGLRKTLGARTKDIASQVMIEATLLTLLSLPFSWLIVYTLIPELNDLLNISFARSALFEPLSIGIFITLLLVTGLISGLYPAMAYSGKSLTNLLGGKLNTVKSGKRLNLRNGLLTAQFFMLIVLVSIMLVIRQQMAFIQEREMGFQESGVVYFEIDGIEKYNLLAARLEQIPEIKVVGSGMIPGQDMYNQLTYKLQGSETILSDGTFIYTSAGAFDVLGITDDAFRNIDESGKVFVINRTAARKIAVVNNIEESELIGKTLISEPEMETEDGFGEKYTIGGIIEDFDYFNLRYESQPLLIDVRSEIGYAYNMMLKVETDNWVSTISDIEAAYQSVDEERPFDLTFLDHHLDQIYEKERNAGVLTAGFTGISLGLAVMGLVGIVGFITLARQKEIGVRKVFGASVRDILIILNKDYLLMMMIATILSVPVVLYLAGKWLDSFAYHISPNVFTVILASVLTLTVVLAVVVSHSLRSANANPSDVLRNE